MGSIADAEYMGRLQHELEAVIKHGDRSIQGTSCAELYSNCGPNLYGVVGESDDGIRGELDDFAHCVLNEVDLKPNGEDDLTDVRATETGRREFQTGTINPPISSC